MFRWLPIVFLALTTALPLSARLNKIDYGKHSSIEDQKANFDVKKPEMNTQFDDSKMDLTQWHSQFSTLGQKKSNLLTGADRFAGEKKEYASMDIKMKNTSMAAGNRKMTQPRNWNYAMDNLMAGKFQGAEITSPVGRQMQQYIDEVNLREVNRFVSQRNQTEEGLPVQHAGQEGMDDIPTQMRDTGAIRTVSSDGDEGDPSVLFRNPFHRNGSDEESDAQREE